MFQKRQILIICDSMHREMTLVNFLNNNFNKEIISANTKWQSSELLNKYADNIEIVVIDVQKKETNGTSFCRLIRNHRNKLIKAIPVLYVSNLNLDHKKIEVLESGVDSYVSNPDSLNIIKAHLNSLLRSNKSGKHIFRHGNLIFDGKERALMIEGQEIYLTATEYMILEILLLNRNKVFSRDEIVSKVYPTYHDVSDRTIDRHITNIRNKLREYDYLLHTYVKHGYGIKN